MATTRGMTAAKETLNEVGGAILAETGWRHNALANLLGVSGKSLRRYMNGHPPPAGRARDMVRSLATVQPALAARMAASLGVDAGLVPTVSLTPTLADAVVAMTVYKVADELDLAPRTTRDAVRMFLDAMVEHGLDARTARAALPAKPR